MVLQAINDSNEWNDRVHKKRVAEGLEKDDDIPGGLPPSDKKPLDPKGTLQIKRETKPSKK